MDAPLDANRRTWDERAPIHARDATGSYRLDRIRAGDYELHAIEDAELGDVSGMRVLHLQCHIGSDTVCLAGRALGSSRAFPCRTRSGEEDLTSPNKDGEAPPARTRNNRLAGAHPSSYFKATPMDAERFGWSAAPLRPRREEAARGGEADARGRRRHRAVLRRRRMSGV